MDHLIGQQVLMHLEGKARWRGRREGGQREKRGNGCKGGRMK